MSEQEKSKELAFHEKMVMIQTEMNAPKNMFNSFGNYNYRNCEGILNALKPFLKEFKLYIKLTDEIEMIGDRFYVKATATIGDRDFSTSTTAYAREEATKKGMDGSQITGSASSYARKYALNGLLAIDDVKDADDDGKGDEKPTKISEDTLKFLTQVFKKEELQVKLAQLLDENHVEKLSDLPFQVAEDLAAKIRANAKARQ